jgi:hypothetical protein
MSIVKCTLLKIGSEATSFVTSSHRIRKILRWKRIIVGTISCLSKFKILSSHNTVTGFLLCLSHSIIDWCLVSLSLSLCLILQWQLSCWNHAQIYYIKVLCFKNQCPQESCNMWQEISIVVCFWLLRNKWHIYWVVQTVIKKWQICMAVWIWIKPIYVMENISKYVMENVSKYVSEKIIQFGSFITQKSIFHFEC